MWFCDSRRKTAVYKNAMELLKDTLLDEIGGGKRATFSPPIFCR